MGRATFRVGRFFALVAALVALTSLATSVNAASFRKSWDPFFSQDFAVLVNVEVGWRGEALVFVDDACVATSADVAFPDDCGVANLLSYELEFYEVGTNVILGMGSDSAPGTPVFPAVNTISFDAASIPNGISLAGALLVPGTFTFGDYSNSFDAELLFDLSGPSLTLVENCGQEQCAAYSNDSQNFPPTVNWEQVPTPATLGLMSLGLLTLGLMRRRRA